MQIDGILISSAEQRDLAQITKIYQEAVLHGTASWEYEPPKQDEMLKRFDLIKGLGLPYFVARKGNDVLGFAHASKYRDRIGYRFCVENSVYINPDFQGHGVGTKLLQALIDKCTNSGFQNMIAVIGDSENHASIKLHEKLGFVKVGLLPRIGYKFDRWLDSLIMQRNLR